MLRTIAALLFGIATTAAEAATFYGSAGGWDVIRGDNNCAIYLEYEGPGSTELMLAKFVDGTIGVFVTNSNWSSVEGKEYEIHLSLNGDVYGGGSATGTKSGYKRGFLTFVDADFATDFSQGASLAIYLEKEKIDQLSLSGTAAAMIKLEGCLSKVRAQIAADEREKQRWSHLPKDPFSEGK